MIKNRGFGQGRSRVFGILLVAASLASLSGLLVAGCQGAREDRPRELQGVIELDERVLAFEVGGKVKSVSIARGDQIAAGAPVAKLDATLAETSREAQSANADATRAEVSLVKAGSRPEQIRAARAEVRAAHSRVRLLEKNLEREKNLLTKGVTTQTAVDEIQTRVATAREERRALDERLKALERGPRRQEVQSAESRATAATQATKLEEERLAKHALSAPIAATVLDVHVEPGEVVGPGTPIATLGDTAHPFADVFVPIGKLDGIAVGTKATVRIDAYDQPFEAKVEHIARTTEFTPRYLFSERERPNLVVRVRLRVSDPEKKLFAGVPAFATLQKGAP